jgi:hypothetical protein
MMKGVYIGQWIPEFELGWKAYGRSCFCKRRAIATYKAGIVK